MLRSAGLIAALATAVMLGYSGYKDLPLSWQVMRAEHSQYAGYTSLQREQAFGAQLPVAMDIMAWYRQHLRPGDRYYIQIQNGAFGRFIDKETAVRSVARLYLLPAIEAKSLRDATVVLSWETDPSTLHLRYSEQDRSGVQLLFVSRIARGA